MPQLYDKITHVLAKYESLLRLISSFDVFFDLDTHENSIAVAPTTPILRHDVDYTIVGVKEMAQLDQTYGHKSIFLFRPDSRSYNLESSHCLELIQYVTYLGHKIGLHIDRRSFMAKPQNQEAALNYVRYFEFKTQQQLSFMSWHRPLPQDLGENESFLGLRSLYSKSFWEKEAYLSDSSGQWGSNRENKLLRFLKERKYFQLLIHHEWWLDEDVSKSFARSYSQQIQSDMLELQNEIPFKELELEKSIVNDFFVSQRDIIQAT